MAPYPGIPASRTADVDRCINDVLTPDFIAKNGGTREKAMDNAVAICVNSIKKGLEGSVKMEWKLVVGSTVEAARLTVAEKNRLPNRSFAVIEPCFLRGDTKDKNARHLPLFKADGSPDIPRIRNAPARVNQIKPICPDSNKEELIREAQKKITAAKKRAGVGEFRERPKAMTEAQMVIASIFIPSSIDQVTASKFLMKNELLASLDGTTKLGEYGTYHEYPQVDKEHIVEGGTVIDGKKYDGYLIDFGKGVKAVIAQVKIPDSKN